MDVAELSALTIPLTRDHLIGLGPLIAGITVVTVLILAVWFGRRRRAREPGPPLPEEQPTAPEEPLGYEIERREPDELEQDGVRHLPQDLHGHGTSSSRPSAAPETRPTWDHGGSSHGTG